MFSIILYYCKTENNRMDKTEYLQKIASIQGNLREQTSIINPSITIELNDQIIKGLIEHKDIVVDDNEIPVKTDDYFPIVIKYRKKVLSANYLWIPQFDRYYFIDDIISVTNTLWRIDCSVDVLMSFKKDILNLDVYASRNEFNYDEFIPDSKVPATCKVNYNRTPIGDLTFIIPTTYTDVSYVIVLGGKYDYSGQSHYYPDFSTSMNKVLITNGYTINKIIDSLMGLNSQGSMFGSSIGDSIQGIYVAPMRGLNTKFNTVDAPFTEDDTNREYTISFLGNTLKVSGNKYDTRIYEIFGNKYSSTTTIYFNLSENNLLPNNFLQYKPYSVAQLFLPFYGILDIEPEFVNKGLYIGYCFCIANNTCSIEIRCPQESKLLYFISDLPFCSELPITYTDLNSKKRNILFSSMQIAAGIAGAAFTGGTSLGLVATGVGSMTSPATKTTSFHHGKGGRLTSMTTTETPAQYAETKKFRPDKLINFASNATIDLMSSFVPKNFGGRGNSLGTAWFLDNIQRPTLYYGTIDYYYPDGYNHLVGRPSRYIGKLSGLYGYTEIAGVHIENINIATSDERTAIEEELKSGVILPNPPSS